MKFHASSKCHHVLPESHLTEAAAAWIQSKSLCQPSLTWLRDMWFCPPPPWNSICACIFLSVNAQPHSARSAMANTHRSAAIPLLLMPCLASSLPPGCLSGSEAKMCRTWGNVCESVCVCVCVGLFVYWGHEPFFLNGRRKELKRPHRAACVFKCQRRKKVLKLSPH